MVGLRVHREECDNVPKHSLERTLCEVAHYTVEYMAPASKADLSYEIGKSPRTEPCIVGAINRGMRSVNRNLPQLLRGGLVKRTEYGGYVLTLKGRRRMRNVSVKYGVRIHTH